MISCQATYLKVAILRSAAVISGAVLQRPMEAAGIEPASENVPLENLHTCQVPIWSYPGLKEPASQPGHQPIRYRPSPPGQQFGAILSKVTPFN